MIAPVDVALSPFARIAIPPLYWLAEQSDWLRGRSLRLPLQRALSRLSQGRAHRARRAFELALPSEGLLDIDLLPELEKQFSAPTRKDRRTPVQKSMARGRELSRLIKRHATDNPRVLDVGSGDGAVAEHLGAAGLQVTGIDIKPPAKCERYRFRQMDAMSMDFPDRTYDWVQSFDSFEHFAQPERVLAEMHRILRPGGMAYLSFGPLYFSPQGAHQWLATNVPYAHVLFGEEVVNRYAISCGRPPIHPMLNRWTVEQFRAMFAAFADRFDVVFAVEKRHVGFVSLVHRFASTFKFSGSTFDSLTVRAMEMLLRRKP